MLFVIAALAQPDNERAITQKLLGDYCGYFGTFSIDLGNKAVVHHIEGSWFPNLVGTDQIRHFRLRAID